jgi:hypothetical protein
MTRLETASEQLAQELRHASVAKQRAATLRACELALQDADVGDAQVQLGLDQLREKGRLTAEARLRLKALADEADENYFDLQEKAPDSRKAQEDYRRFFRQARALSALYFAGEDDVLAGAMESIYEASVAVDDKDGFYKSVRTALAD